MPQNKSHHFVPQFSLRFFSHSSSDKLIGVYHLPHGPYVERAKIKDHACDDYLYGKDGVENGLQRIESNTRPILADIIATEKLPDWESQQHRDLAYFAILQKDRTPEAAAQADDQYRILTELRAAECGSDPTHLGNAGAQAGFESTPRLLLEMATKSYVHVLDLRYKLLKNNTNVPFITSDHPVVSYNQFFERRGGQTCDTGIMCRGLQLFLPISPKHLLVFFDSEVYKVNGRFYNLTPANVTESDVEALNILQAVNAGTHLFFNDAAGEPYLRNLAAKAEPFVKSANGRGFVKPANWGQQQGKLIAVQGVDLRTGLRLSCFGQLPSAGVFDSDNPRIRLRKPEILDQLLGSSFFKRSRRFSI